MWGMARPGLFSRWRSRVHTPASGRCSPVLRPWWLTDISNQSLSTLRHPHRELDSSSLGFIWGYLHIFLKKCLFRLFANYFVFISFLWSSCWSSLWSRDISSLPDMTWECFSCSLGYFPCLHPCPLCPPPLLPSKHKSSFDGIQLCLFMILLSVLWYHKCQMFCVFKDTLPDTESWKSIPLSPKIVSALAASHWLASAVSFGMWCEVGV